jgi:hypothetical protein
VSPNTLQEIRKENHHAKQTHLVDVSEALSLRDELAISGVPTSASLHESEVRDSIIGLNCLTVKWRTFVTNALKLWVQYQGTT